MYSSLQADGYTMVHPSAFDSGLVYETSSAIVGRLPDGAVLRWPGATEPALGPMSVVAIRPENSESVVLERTRYDPDWREIFSRPTIVHDPAVAPDGDSIVFSELAGGRYRICQWARETGQIRILLERPGDFRYPVYSPDGKWLAFAGNQAGNWDICLYSFEDFDYRSLTTSLANDYMPAFSLDGRDLYFASDRRRGYRFTAIYRMGIAQ
jgi:hypothetical protein